MQKSQIPPSSLTYVRDVGGQVLSTIVAHTSVGRIEVCSRSVADEEDWHFCQPETTLFWHRNGYRRMRGAVNGTPVDCNFTRNSRLSMFPREADIKMNFDLRSRVDYVAIFFDPEKVGRRARLDLRQARIAFSNDELTRGLSELCQEAVLRESLFDLYAEGWALQALVHAVRIAGSGGVRSGLPTGGLTTRARSDVEMFIQENLAESLTLEELAGVAGVSKRHFLRAFFESFGTPPHRYVVAMRIEEAKRQLASSKKTLTEIALDCGFSHAQHFSTTFRRAAGLTPSRYRQQAHREGRQS